MGVKRIDETEGGKEDENGSRTMTVILAVHIHDEHDYVLATDYAPTLPHHSRSVRWDDYMWPLAFALPPLVGSLCCMKSSFPY